MACSVVIWLWHWTFGYGMVGMIMALKRYICILYYGMKLKSRIMSVRYTDGMKNTILLWHEIESKIMSVQYVVYYGMRSKLKYNTYMARN